MNLKAFFSQGVCGLLIAVATAQSWATPVPLIQVSGDVGFSCGTGTGGFEHLCQNGEHVEHGTFSLIYDPLMPDQDDTENRGNFSNAITSFRMTVSQVNRPDLEFFLSGRGSMSIYYSYGADIAVYWSMILKEKNNVYGPSSFLFNVVHDPMVINPNELPAVDFWNPRAIFGYSGGGAGVNETDWLYPNSVFVQAVPRPVPEPVSSSLVFLGLVVFFAQRGRARKPTRRPLKNNYC